MSFSCTTLRLPIMSVVARPEAMEEEHGKGMMEESGEQGEEQESEHQEEEQ